MKKLIPLLLVSMLLYVAVAVGATPPITVPPSFTAPQEQASELAVPTDTRPALKTVITVIQCNSVIGLLGIDEAGEVHAAHFTSKADVQAIQKAVPADHNLGLNVGCPNNASKDTTVL